jgi:hypothetical protein
MLAGLLSGIIHDRKLTREAQVNIAAEKINRHLDSRLITPETTPHSIPTNLATPR